MNAQRTGLLLLFLATSTGAQNFQAAHPLSGRRIAPVMGYEGADWLERPEREAEEHPDDAIEALALRPGMIIAEIGAGTGYMAIRIAKKLGPSGRVFANDLQPDMLRR